MVMLVNVQPEMTELADRFRISTDISPSRLSPSYWLGKSREQNLLQELTDLKKKMLIGVPASVSGPLNISIDLRGEPANSVVFPELFSEFQERTYPGREDLGVLRMFGGATATGSPFFRLADALSAITGIKIEIHSLAGHDGNWDHYRNVTNKMWVEQILDTSKKDDLSFPLSTAGNAMAQALGINPNACGGVVGIGWPLFLRNVDNENLMEKVRRYSGPLKYFLRNVSVSYPRTEDDPDPCPQFIRMPLSVAIELRKSQIGALNAVFGTLAKAGNGYNFPPILYAQGENDFPVHPLVRDFMASGFIRSPLKMVPELYPNADHTVQSGPAMYHFMLDVMTFMHAFYIHRGFKEEELPPALRLHAKAASFTKPALFQAQ
jgi:hypothetical protein